VNGTMLWFHEERGAGFLQAEDGERLPVDIDGFIGAAPVGRCAGLAVTFTVVERDGTRIATDVSLTESDAPRRARRRGSGMRGGS
jgi:cold shock CspA family protein